MYVPFSPRNCLPILLHCDSATNYLAYGGSWADDEIDIASISVPIEKNRGYSGSADLYRSGYGGGGYGSRGSNFMDNGPPYIVKLANLPVTSNDDFVEDLFRSRYTSFVKFKIVFDPSSQPLESGIVKKIAFVELSSFSDQSRVLKWHDLFYRGSRRVVIESADFLDFKNCMSFNQENEQKLRDVEREFLAGRNRHGWADDHDRGTHGHGPMNGAHGHQLLGFGRGALADRAPPPNRTDNMPALGGHLASEEADVPKKIAVASHPKPNPFGNAKPVDILSKQHEIEKQLITINHTTIKTAGTMEPPKSTKKSSEGKSADAAKTSTHKEVTNGEVSATGASTKKPGFAPAPIPTSVYGPKQSLADILAKNDSDLALSPKQSARKSATATPKPHVIKPTILKKKPAVTSSPTQHHVEPILQSEEHEEAVTSESAATELNGDSPHEAAEVKDPNVDTPVAASVEKTSSKESINGQEKPSKRRELKSREPRDSKDSKEPKVTRKPKQPREESSHAREPKELQGSRDSRNLAESKPLEVSSNHREGRGPRVQNLSRSTQPREQREKKAPRGKVVEKKEAIPKELVKDDEGIDKKSKLQNLSERNKAFASSNRPDFKKHLTEMTNAMEREHKTSRRSRGGKKWEKGDGKQDHKSEHKPEHKPGNGSNGDISHPETPSATKTGTKEQSEQESRAESGSSERAHVKSGSSKSRGKPLDKGQKSRRSPVGKSQSGDDVSKPVKTSDETSAKGDSHEPSDSSNPVNEGSTVKPDDRSRRGGSRGRGGRGRGGARGGRGRGRRGSLTNGSKPETSTENGA